MRDNPTLYRATQHGFIHPMKEVEDGDNKDDGIEVWFVNKYGIDCQQILTVNKYSLSTNMILTVNKYDIDCQQIWHRLSTKIILTVTVKIWMLLDAITAGFYVQNGDNINCENDDDDDDDNRGIM